MKFNSKINSKMKIGHVNRNKKTDQYYTSLQYRYTTSTVYVHICIIKNYMYTYPSYIYPDSLV